MQDRIWEIVAKKLAGEASVHELEELEEILRSNPELHYSLQTISDIWFHTSPLKEDANQAFERHLQRMKDHGVEMEPDENEAVIDFEEKHPRSGWIKWMAATTLILLAGWFFLVKESSSSRSNTVPTVALNSEVSTKNGSRSKIMLPDGTQVWLNAGSKLTYGKDFGTSFREVSLTGEAYFDVVKDSSRPFLIHARNVDIRVLGTAFNVKSYPGDKTTETSLIRGSVEVQIKNRPSEKIILKPNEKLVVAMESDSLIAKPSQPQVTKNIRTAPQVVLDQVNYHEKEQVIVETSWVENILIFDSETFAELAPKLERWYGIKIVFTSQEIQNIRLTGSFKGESLQTALKGLKITANFNYAIKNDTVIISP
ncbi:FecR family protein [Flavihumibacter sp. UBA7668]|uniref:FecR family protein n=1 Tax=Flavihumibacter sp. UBA7668 TaxID=1946542 RepID=UPI0025BE426C|nr:FecR domain-containing protein [Flavihumibacter sp. UBA7668]